LSFRETPNRGYRGLISRSASKSPKQQPPNQQKSWRARRLHGGGFFNRGRLRGVTLQLGR
jgi:hypothetical protein